MHKRASETRDEWKRNYVRLYERSAAVHGGLAGHFSCPAVEAERQPKAAQSLTGVKTAFVEGLCVPQRRSRVLGFTEMLGLLLLYTFCILRLAHTIPSSTQSRRKPANLTLYGHAHCTDSRDWIGQGYFEADCVDAIAKLQHTDFSRHGEIAYEFLAPGARPVYGFPAVQTPKRYRSASCTVVIAMLKTFQPGLLPDEPPRLPYGYSDVTSFAELWSAVRAIDHLCVGPHRGLGWAMEGHINHAIGIFLLSTASNMNRDVPGRLLRLPKHAANVTVSSLPAEHS